MHTIIQKSKKIVSKLKMLDWIVIVLVSGITLFLVISSLNQNRWVTIEFKVQPTIAYTPDIDGLTNPYWVVDKITAGSTQYDSLGQKNLEILNVKRWGFQNEDTWVKASVKAKYKPSQKKYTYLYQPLEIGRYIDLTINGAYIHGVITSIEGYADTRKTYTITVDTRLIDISTPYSTSTRGVDPWVADAIEKGQTMKDTAGNIIAEILDVETKPAERVITTSDGRIVIGDDPLKRDVAMTIRLRVTKQNDTYFFLEDRPIKVGSAFPMFFKQMPLHPVVTQFLEEK
jgi:hypothetical protein